MNEIQVFESPEFGSIRTLMIDGEPWFVGKDIAEKLEYRLTRKAILDHVDADDVLKWNVIDSLGRTQETTIINESGLYSIILTSRKPEARAFKRWVTHEVLPAIRKTGKYETATANRADLTKEDYLKAASMVAECKNERLPYVLSILEQAGVSVPVIEQSVPTTDENDWNKAVKIMQKYSVRQLSKMLNNIPISCINYYRNGKYKPFPERQAKIIRILLNK